MLGSGTRPPKLFTKQSTGFRPRCLARARSPGRKACAVATCPRKFTLICASKSSKECDMKSPVMQTPAQHTTARTSANTASVASRSPAMEASSVMSHCTAMASRPGFKRRFVASVAASSVSTVRAARTTCQPSSAKRAASARPTPSLAPVITAAGPCKGGRPPLVAAFSGASKAHRNTQGRRRLRPERRCADKRTKAAAAKATAVAEGLGQDSW
mmetsp:Transcript_99030/g.295837  ORF Transcript_99030/g.295837 Transcript_99030/m.295837 type:complete len:214 (-) Transcript_99030:164-805(-)